MRRALALAVIAVLAPAGGGRGRGGERRPARRRPRSRRGWRSCAAWSARTRGSFSQVTSPVTGQWQVAFYSRDQEFVQVIVSADDGRVLGQYTGFQIAWTMARGYPGASAATSTRSTSGCR